MICADANLLIGLISTSDSWHGAATEVLAETDGIRVLNVTRAEALVRPYREGEVETVLGLLDSYGVETVEVSNEIADRAARLRADHGNRHFPMVDALVVALGIENDLEIVTTDDKWPTIPDARIRVLSD